MFRVTIRRIVVHGKMRVTRWSWYVWARHGMRWCAEAHWQARNILLVLKVGFHCWGCSYMSRVTIRRIIVHGKMGVARWSWWRGTRWHGATKKILWVWKVGFHCLGCSSMSMVTIRRIIVRGKNASDTVELVERQAAAWCVCAKAHGQPRKFKIARGDGGHCWECSYMSIVTLRSVIVHGKMRVTMWKYASAAVVLARAGTANTCGGMVVQGRQCKVMGAIHGGGLVTPWWATRGLSMARRGTP
jgi:hypothetical protein